MRKCLYLMAGVALLAAGEAPAAPEEPAAADKVEQGEPAYRDDPQALVKSVTGRVLETLRKHKDRLANDTDFLEQKVEELILPHLDFVAMSKLALGKHWRSASAEQREAFIEQFKTLLIRTYQTSLTEYSDQSVDFLPFRESNRPDKLAVVRSEIKRSGAPSIPIIYKLRYRDSDGWKVYDINIEGVSLVTNYRSSFSREVNQNGIDALIRSLQERNQKSGEKNEPAAPSEPAATAS